MYLKKLKVRNFKSFAGSAEIAFQPGLTGVAGPNGMGKSNISDAILFVLGPTSSKALRADRLTHLFFNGGSSKKPATECEVSLVFDNQDRLLPVESEEVELTRYVKLTPNDPDGYYSYFYTNGRRTTQTEMDSILSHARLSGDGYNLVQQGDINRVVSMGPIPRRAYLERLAGISQYDEELGRAETKRTDLETNLDRIRTLLGEIRGHLGQLESQRLQAIQYKELDQQKRRAEARLARQGHRLADQEVASCEKQLEGHRAELVRLEAELKARQTEQYDAAEAIDRLDREIAVRAGPEAAKFREELAAKRLAFARLEDDVQDLETKVHDLDDKVTALTEEIATDEKELTRLTQVEKETTERSRALDVRSEEAAKALAAATGAADPAQGKLVGARRQILELERTIAQLQTDWQAQVGQRETAKASAAAADRDEAAAEDDHRTRELELKDLERRARGTASDGGPKGSTTSDLQKELFQLKAKEKTLTATAESAALELSELNRRYTALDARLKVRGESAGRAGGAAAVDFLLSQRNLGRIPGIRGTVEELAKFRSEDQPALQVAAGPRFQALVVETDQVAEECIRILRSEKRGRATFLPLNKMLAGRPHGKSMVVAQGPGSKGFALDLVEFDEALRPAFWYVFGETVVMEDLAAARSQMGGVRLVTRQGDLIEATGAISGGFLDAGPGRGAESAAELKRLGEELRARGAAETDARAELGRIAERLRTVSEELAKRSGEASARDSALKVLQEEVDAARERLKESVRRISAAQRAREAAAAALQTAEAESARLEGALGERRAGLSKSQEEYLGQLPGALSSRIRTLQESARLSGEERVAMARELEAAKAARGAAAAALEERKTERAGLVAEHQTAEKDGRQHRAQRDEARASLDAMKQLEAKQLADVEQQSTQRKSLDARRLEATAGAARSQEAIRSRTSLVTQEEARLAVARQRLAELEEALKAYPEPGEDEAPVPLAELKQAIQTLAAQLEALGSVNLRALEEYDAEKSRLDDFEGEVARLGTEKEELQKLVGEIEEKKKAKLLEVVVAVNTLYREIYGELSGGGTGEIALENPSAPLAGGLLIQASPVGKLIQRLEQLSGGEKSLASLAFIFALQRFDPSPLYVFDEVDMSLDGVNAENVGRMLRRNSERAQFIVISLRKVTLKFARHLFGVTMHGDGCSRVVTLRLDEIVDLEERERGSPVASAPAVEAR